MPELPEVETIRRALEPRLTGARFIAAETHPSDKFTDAMLAVGTTVTGVGRRAKFLLVGLDNDHELVIHLGMTGAIYLGEPLDNEKYVRASWELDDGRTLTFDDTRRFGRIRYVRTGDYSSMPTLHNAGPEPFDPSFDGPHLWQAVRNSKRHIKTQLLSQKPVAGVGNIYADEALWLAQVNPAKRSITKAQAAVLAEAITEVMESALANGGTTLRDYKNLDGGEGSNQFQLHCYGRSGSQCDRCATVLRLRVLDARSTTWCPQCQPA
jgi:formamidopyrimidine-DNA glycosylase